MPIERMILKSSIRDYPVVFEKSPDFLEKLAQTPNVAFVVDEHVWDCYATGCLATFSGHKVFVLPISEERKRLESVLELYDWFMARAAKRNTLLVSIGGGITQDITGFLASTLYRGINWVFVPTTLLAQADSCIGSKTSLNYRQYKNLIGTFYPPSSVHVYPDFLETQAEVDYFSGLGEMVKLHMMGGEQAALRLVDHLPELRRKDPGVVLEAVTNALMIKQDYIESDEFDTGRRNLLNFGHCFGHAIESATNFAVPHGQAVVLGIVLANIVARMRGLLSDSLDAFLTDRLLLPSTCLEFGSLSFNHQNVIEAMKQDKKRTGSGLALVMLINEYEMMKVTDLTEAEAINALETFKESYCAKLR